MELNVNITGDLNVSREMKMLLRNTQTTLKVSNAVGGPTALTHTPPHSNPTLRVLGAADIDQTLF